MAITSISKLDLERMRNSDGVTSSKVSFSGADYKAVVFMPLDQTVLGDEIFLTRSRLELAQDEYATKLGAYKHYSELVDYNTELATVTWATSQAWYEAADKEANPILKAQYLDNARKAHKEYTEYQYSRQASLEQRSRYGATESELEQLTDEMYAYTLELDRLTAAQGKGEKYTRAIELGDVQTITWSTFREKKPVRTFGRVNPKARTRGQRTIAGSLIFTVFDRASLWELLQAHTALANTGVRRNQSGTYPSTEGVLVDQLAPFDISIIASNEVGDNSSMVLYGVEIHSEGTTLSIQDMLTENVMQFTASDIDVLRPLGERRLLEEPGKVDLYPNAENADDVVSAARKRRSARLNPFV